MMKKIDKGTLQKRKLRNAWAFSGCINLLFSFGLPYLMALFFFLVSDYSLSDIFSRSVQYVLVGTLIYMVLTIFSCYLSLQNVDAFLRKSTTLLLVFSIFIAFCISPLLAEALTVYAFPLLFCGLLAASLIDSRFGSVVASVLPVLFFFCYIVLEPNADMYSLISSLLIQILAGNFIIIFTKRKYTRASYLLVAVLVGILVALPIAILCTVLRADENWRNYLVNGAFAFSSVLIGLACFMLTEPVFEYMFGLYSSFRLEEICSPSAPLLERLASEAPGTYNHSVAMSILAQDCAKAIGENAALAKAGACYHDVGKLKNPICFTENQTDYNPHDDFIPEVSVAMITRHTHDGAEIIRKNGLPEMIARIAEEHHGDQPVSFFLNKTRGMTEQKLEKTNFSYRGPKPSSKISGIIMIVDTVEAATRAQGIQKDEKELRRFIHKLIMEKMELGQFSDCPLTLRDFTVIEETLVTTIPGLYHQRIRYTK